MQEKKKSYVKPFARVIALQEPIMAVVGSGSTDPGTSESKPRPSFPDVIDDDDRGMDETYTPFVTGDGKNKSVWED